MRVIPFGTNGFFPSFGRQTACYAIPLGNTLIILDAGSGLFRFAEPIGQNLLKEASEIHLYLSHYHLDHTFGFYAATKFFQEKKVTVFGEKTKEVFSEFPNLQYFPVDYQKHHANFSWLKLKEGKNSLDSYLVYVRKQYHNGAGSLAFRFSFKDQDFAYITDSEPTKEGIEFIRGVDLLLHEHYLSGEEKLKDKDAKLEDHFAGKHVTTVGAATIAKEAKVGSLALIHHFPFYDDKRLEKLLRIARSISPDTFLAQDLKSIDF